MSRDTYIGDKSDPADKDRFLWFLGSVIDELPQNQNLIISIEKQKIFFLLYNQTEQLYISTSEPKERKN